MSTPAEHYEKADALMARVDEMKNAALPISIALTQQAQVHALLAQCDPDDYRDGYVWARDAPEGWRRGPRQETRPATGGRL